MIRCKVSSASSSCIIPARMFLLWVPERRMQFRDVTYKAAKSQWDKRWRKKYNAKKLALLAFLIHHEEFERKLRWPRPFAPRGAKKKGGEPAE